MVLRGSTYWMDRTIDGVRHREPLGIMTKAEAREAEARRVREIQTAGKVPAGELRRAGFIEAAAAYQRARKGVVAESTWQTEADRLVPLSAFFGEEPVAKLNQGRLEAYRESRLNAGTAAGTVNAETSLFKRVVARAGREIVLAPIPVREEVGRVMEPAEKARLVELAQRNPLWRRAYLAAQLALATGMRRSELRNLTWGDVDLYERTLQIRKGKRPASDRVVPLNTEALGILLELRDVRAGLKPEDLVLPWKSFRKAWEALRRAAGLPWLRFHDLRHQVVTELLENGVPDSTVKSLVGHVSQRMLEHYSHQRIEAKRRAVEGLGGCAPALEGTSWAGA